MKTSYCFSLVVILTMNCLTHVTQAFDCINGDILGNGTCDCFLGWMGDACDMCGGRIRLTDKSGVIADDVSGSQYSKNTQCMFFLEADKPANKIHLRIRVLHTECQWDYLHVFDGDSVFTQKLAAYTGDIVEQQVPPIAGNDSVPSSDQAPPGIVLSSTSSQLLVYFYTDVAAHADGFEIEYWMDYTCPVNCSGHGRCLDNGTCECDSEWYGDHCDFPICPNNCSSNGECDLDTLTCSCSPGYGDLDCSVDLVLPFWSRVTYSWLSENLTLATLARASHSAVLWGGDILIYGGYQFPHNGYSSFRHDVFYSSGDTSDELLQYHVDSGSWELLITSSNVSSNESTPLIPSPRYGHTAVVYNDTMYVYGGAKWPSEEIVSELWALDLHTLLWTPLFTLHSKITEHDNSTLSESIDILSILSFQPLKEYFLPLPIRSHTAHVVGSKMIVLFGLSSGTEVLISYVQEYNFDTGEWSVPHQRGFSVSGRMGHASVYDPKTGLIYVEGGVTMKHGGNTAEITTELLTYNPLLHSWSRLSASGSRHYLHTINLLGPLLVVFGGCQGSTPMSDCYTNELTVYNTLCDTWKVVEYPGLPINSSRYSHSTILHQNNNSLLVFGGFLGSLHHDMLQLHLANCSIHQAKNECLHQSAFCAWSTGQQERCVSVVEADNFEIPGYSCAIDLCNFQRECFNCNKQEECSWSSDFRCIPSNSSDYDCSNPQGILELCSDYKHCESCFAHDCQWNGSHCFSPFEFKELNVTQSECSATSCISATTCRECTETRSGCLWCPSLNHCVHESLYPYTYIHGQCLGWVSQSFNCSGNCSDYKTCSDCQNDPYCGWCNDPSDTGLGECTEGGFISPKNSSICMDYSDEETYGRWFFDICPACQCNGHSSCVNTSVCEACQNNTDGDNCEVCRAEFWGDPRNGGTCEECDCNGYNSVCDISTGVCECLSFGVTGNHCRQCDAISEGDANNFCFSKMQVNFIYTYSVDMDREQEGFFIVTPPEDKALNFKLEITSNPRNQVVNLQLFVGKTSENLWVLTNLTDPIVLESLGSHKQSFGDFTSNSNHSLAQLHSFARPSILQLSNFTTIFSGAVENDYTSSMWDGDTSLVIFLFNLTSPTTFRITVDQQDFLFLLYFFITFITCFSVLLTAFLLGWYIKQKITVRNLLRQQYIELQRRVARPFARIKLELNKLNTVSDGGFQQLASYAGVETCRDNKAAILSLLVRLPGNQVTGQPVMSRPSLCVGSTLVRVNPQKKSIENTQVKKRKNQGRFHESNTEATVIQSGDVQRETQNMYDVC